MKKRLLSIALLLVTTACIFAAGTQEKGKTENEKIKMTIMTEITNIPVMTPVTERLVAAYPNVEFTRKQFNSNDANQLIKTAFAGGEAIDLTVYWYWI